MPFAPENFRFAIPALVTAGLFAVVANFGNGDIYAATGPVVVKQTVAGYQDNAGQSRGKAAFDVGADGPGMSSILSSIKLSIARERVEDSQWRDNKYLQAMYGDGVRVSDSWTVSGVRNFGKLTDARIAAGASSDGVVRSQNLGIGASQWFVHETLQTALDLSRVEVQRPEYEILDFDATVLTAPPEVSTSGATLSLRHLATPVTMALYSATFSHATDRPLARFFQAGVRQYVPGLGGAFHGTLYRGVNRGGLSTQTMYGQVDSWSADLAWVQEFGQATQLRAGWRVYQERETGRAYRDVTQFGSDLFSIGFAHDVKPDLTAGKPVTIEAGVARYLTNNNLTATTANLGVSGRL